MFRRLYWVIEIFNASGESRVAGVYTSIPDLIRQGLVRSSDGNLRITLTKLDSSKDPFGSWIGPDFTGLEERLQEFVATEEFSVDETKALMSALDKVKKAAV